MEYVIRVKRRAKGGSEQHFQSFRYEGSGEESVSAVLDKLNTNDDLYDIDGNPADKIVWSCSCHQGMCGACAMVINKVPALACRTLLKNLNSTTVTLEPLSKFPVSADLETDKSSLYNAPIAHGIWHRGEANIDGEQYELEYEASKCLKCGICVEVCPKASIKGGNLGAAFAVDCYLQFVQNRERSDKDQMKREFRENFASDCCNCMACANNCPAGIDIRRLAAYMNE